MASGCGGGRYCPSSIVTRAQMAVFLLRAEYGAEYVPPTAVGIFADVLITDPFTPWIEELSVEGVTAGCGNGNYCPNSICSESDPVPSDRLPRDVVLPVSLP